MSHACEIIAATRPEPRLLVSCEHASNRLPEGWAWDDRDRWLEPTHWAHDIGAADLARELAHAAGAPAVLARFSRLLIDPNRPPDAATLVRTQAEGRPIYLNQGLDARELARRMALWEAYHETLDHAAATSGDSVPPGTPRTPGVLFAVHSFTPEYEGRAREMEIGVLFDQEEELAARLRSRLERIDGIGPVRFNEPYSGKAGLMYSPQRHAAAHGMRALEIEVRQDRILEPRFRATIVEATLAVLA